MKHKTKRTLVFLYMALTVVSLIFAAARRWDLGGIGFSWAETMAGLLLVLGWDAVGWSLVLAYLPGILLVLSLVAAPVCACFRVYWPFKVLLGVKAVLIGFMAFLEQHWYFGVITLLHVALFIMSLVFFNRTAAEDALDVEITDTLLAENRPQPSQGLYMPGDGFPNE